MAAPKPILYATGVTVLCFICLVLACITLFLPIWGYFEDRYGGYQAERGYFGPWKVCKKLNYGREVCGDRFRFQVSGSKYFFFFTFFHCFQTLCLFYQFTNKTIDREKRKKIAIVIIILFKYLQLQEAYMLVAF